MVFMVVLSVSTFFIIRNHIDSAKQNEVYDNLAEIVEDEPPKENEGVTFSEDKDYLAEYLELYRQNEDIREAMKSAEPEAIAFWKAVAPDGKEPPIEKVIAMIALNVNNRMYN